MGFWTDQLKKCLYAISRIYIIYFYAAFPSNLLASLTRKNFLLVKLRFIISP